MKKPETLKFLWSVCGILGIAGVSWSLWEVQTLEESLRGMIWLLLCGSFLLASACFFYLAWEKTIILAARGNDLRKKCSCADPESGQKSRQG